MGKFNKGGYKSGGRRDFGRPSFGKKSWGGERREVMMHQATCGECDRSCEVPFRPTEGKPVYCKNCFGAKGNSRDTRGGDRFPRKNFGNGGGVASDGGYDTKRAIEFLTIKIDRLIQSVENLAHMKFK